ncbi:MAG: hypothetical protein KDD45_11575, partial [Bdellovibrionales bacterium]|nr:hypothetical protein [Bdellovibrionales bacterium]
LKSEITELKEENDKLKNYEIAGYIAMKNEMEQEIERYKKFAEHEFKIKEKYIIEITKLKKSRDILREACEFYGDKENWDIYQNKGYEYFNFTFQRINKNDLEAFAIGIDTADRYGGKKAREAIKADDEIMGEG